MTSAPVPPLLEVRHLHVAYGKVEAVHDLSLVVAPGTIVSVIGPNGAGKTTLLAALMGLLPARGEIAYLGAPATRLSVEQRVAHGLVLVPERRELFAAMSVADNLELGGFQRARSGERNWRTTRDEVYRRFPRLEERRDQLAGTLSGGERQMLAMGRALMGKPRLLMLDEPSLGLAPLIVREIFNIIGELRASGVSILLVEQNARAALQVSDYGYVLETGELALEGGAPTSRRIRALRRHIWARVRQQRLEIGGDRRHLHSCPDRPSPPTIAVLAADARRPAGVRLRLRPRDRRACARRTKRGPVVESARCRDVSRQGRLRGKLRAPQTPQPGPRNRA